MPRNSIAKKKFDVKTGVANFTFSNGSEINVSISDLPDDVVKYATGHGLLQGLGDAYSGVSSPEDGMKALNDRVAKWKETGVWATRGAGGGSTRITIFHQALFNIISKGDNPKTMEEVSEMIAEKSAQDEAEGTTNIKDLKAHSQVRAAVANIASENAKKKAKIAAKEVGEEEEVPLSF